MIHGFCKTCNLGACGRLEEHSGHDLSVWSMKPYLAGGGDSFRMDVPHKELHTLNIELHKGRLRVKRKRD